MDALVQCKKQLKDGTMHYFFCYKHLSGACYEPKSIPANKKEAIGDSRLMTAGKK